MLLLFGSGCFRVITNWKGIRKPLSNVLLLAAIRGIARGFAPFELVATCSEEFVDLPSSAHRQKKSGGFSPNGSAIFMWHVGSKRRLIQRERVLFMLIEGKMS